MVETKKTTAGESRHQYCYSCVIKHPDQNDRYAAVINRIDDQIAEKDRQIKALDRHQVCLSFVWVAWAILMGWLLFFGCAPSTSSPIGPQPGTEEPTPPTPPTTPTTSPQPPQPPDLFNITLNGVDTFRHYPMHQEALNRAKLRWEKVITEGLPDVTIPRLTRRGLPAPWSLYYTGDLEVDDIVVHVTYGGGVHPKGYYATGGGWVFPHLRNDPPLPIIGEITIYDPLLRNTDRDYINAVFIHELGHVLGFQEPVLRDQAGIDVIGGAPYFLGGGAALAYQFVLNRVGQQPAMASNIVPMAQNDEYLSHWKYPELGWDVMNSYSIAGKVLSPVTIGAMADLGYKVDILQAGQPRIPRAGKLAVLPLRSFCGGGEIHTITP